MASQLNNAKWVTRDGSCSGRVYVFERFLYTPARRASERRTGTCGNTRSGKAHRRREHCPKTSRVGCAHHKTRRTRWAQPTLRIAFVATFLGKASLDTNPKRQRGRIDALPRWRFGPLFRLPVVVIPRACTSPFRCLSRHSFKYNTLACKRQMGRRGKGQKRGGTLVVARPAYSTRTSRQWIPPHLHS